MTWEDLKKVELNQSFDIRDLRDCCRAVYGAIAWPGKREGCAVVVAMSHSFSHGESEVCLIAEYESFSVRDIVRQSCGLDVKYGPKQWIGNREYGPAQRFINEMNDNLTKRKQKTFSLSEPFELLEMKPLYPYILDEIRRLRNEDRRRLFLPDDSKIRNYLSEIEADEIADLELGAYPAAEALAFGTIEILRQEKYLREQGPYRSPYDNDVLRRGFKKR